MIIVNNYKIIKIDGKYGIKCNGEIIIEPKYDYIKPFNSDGYAPFKMKKLWGSIDVNGKVHVEPKYNEVDELCLGYSIIKYKEYYGYINTRWEEIIKPQYIKAYKFKKYDNIILALVHSISGNMLYVDELGNEYINIFSTNKFVLQKSNESWGIINSRGQYEHKYNYMSKFENGVSVVAIGDKFGHVNDQMQEITPIEFESAKNFSEGRAAVKLLGKWGYIDKEYILTRHPVIPFQYYFADDYICSKAKVNNEYRIDWYGDRVIENDKIIRYHEPRWKMPSLERLAGSMAVHSGVEPIDLSNDSYQSIREDGKYRSNPVEDNYE